MLTPEQIEARRTGLGGSDAAAVLGLSKFRTPLSVYLEKVDPAALPVQKSPEWLHWRWLMEPAIRAEWALRTGLTVDVHPITLRSEQYPWMVANVDGLVGREAGVEVKTVAFSAVDNWGEPGTDEIPQEYLIQVIHYMVVTGRARWYVPALFNGAELRTYVVERPADTIIDVLIARERAFWIDNVEARIPPPIVSTEDARALWPKDKGGTIHATEEIEARWQLLHGYVVEGRRCEAAAEEQRTAIKAYMQDSATLLSPAGKTLATWKSSADSLHVDVDKLRDADPELVRQFTTMRPGARRFLLKGDKTDA